MKHLAIISVSLCAIGCHASAPDTPDASTIVPVDAAPAYASPQVPDLGGPRLAAPSIVTITWPDDPLATSLISFDAWFVQSATWAATLGQYGIQAGSATATWTVPTAAPMTIDDSALQALLHDAIQAGTLARPTAGTLYALYPPATTTVTQTFGTAVYKSCDNTFSGYHGTTALDDGTPIYYAVTARCPAVGTDDALDVTTWSASHELAETVTDPDIEDPAWRIPYDDGTAWITPYGGEVGDLCEGYPLRIETYLITALYSNAAAAAAQRPCVPAPPGPFFAAVSDPHELSLAEGAGTDVALSIASPQAGVTGLTLSIYSIPPGVTISPATAKVSAGDALSVHVALAAAMPPGDYNVVMSLSDGGYGTDTYLVVTP